MRLSEDDRARMNAQIGTIRGMQTAVSVLGRQFIRRHREEKMPPEAIAQVNALVNLINNDLRVEENNLTSLMESAQNASMGDDNDTE